MIFIFISVSLLYVISLTRIMFPSYASAASSSGKQVPSAMDIDAGSTSSGPSRSGPPPNPPSRGPGVQQGAPQNQPDIVAPVMSQVAELSPVLDAHADELFQKHLESKACVDGLRAPSTRFHAAIHRYNTGANRAHYGLIVAVIVVVTAAYQFAPVTVVLMNEL